MVKGIRRRELVGLASVLGTAAVWAQSAAFPVRPITFVLPAPPGGVLDAVSRIVAEKLQATLGQPVLLDYRPGGNMLIATNYVRSQPPDGHTLYFIPSTAIEQPALRPKVARFDPSDDLTPIISVGKVRFVLVVRRDLPAQNLADFLQLARSRPEGLSMATLGTGASDHLAGELIAARTGAKLLAVPYKGAAPAIADVAAGVVDGKIADLGSARPFIEGGRVRVIASLDLTRAPGATVETISETVPGVEAPIWLGVVGPKGMSAKVVTLLNSRISAIMQMPEVNAKMLSLGIETAISSPEEMRVAIRSRVAHVAQLMRDRNLSFDE